MHFESCSFSDSYSNLMKNVQVVGKSIIKCQDDEILPTKEQDREFNILTDCQKCLSKYQDPVTLSCGFTLCYDCIPQAQFKCLSFTCLRTHELDTKRINITLKDILSSATSVTQIQQALHCSVCLQPFHEPITTECGHTFCKECLIRIMTDLKNRICPMCRFELNRIGKPCQVVNHWTQFIYYQRPTICTTTRTKMTSLISELIPIIKLSTLVVFPTQNCLFQINQHNNQSLFKQMTQDPYQHHYALCLFYSKENEHYYDYGIMVKINHVDYSSDIQHSVIQVRGLFRLRIHQLLQDGTTGTFISYVTRLEDTSTMKTGLLHRSLSTPTHRHVHTQTPHIIPPPKPMSMTRPCSMKLSYNSSVVPNNTHPYHDYRKKTWTSTMQFNNKPPAQQKQVDPIVVVGDLFELKQKLNARVEAYLQKKDPGLLLKYECLYHGQDIEYIWWLCSILPLEQDDKIYLFSLLSLRDRILVLTDYMDKKKITM